MKSLVHKSEVLKAVSAVVLGVVGFMLVPVYDMPFGGCDRVGWSTLRPGCSHWFEAFRGFLFVLPVAVLAPKRFLLPVTAVTILLVFGVLGGVDSVRTGQHLSIQALGDLYYGFLLGYPAFFGGAFVVGFWAIFKRN